jgi:hypothetical protein
VASPKAAAACTRPGRRRILAGMAGRLGLRLPVFILVAAALAVSAATATAAEGRQSFRGTIGTTGVSGKRHVVASVVVAKGVYNGVGNIVEVPNRPGDSDRVSRDDLVFPEGTMHLKSVTTKASIVPDPKTCTFTFRVRQTGTIEGGTGRFANATGSSSNSLVTGQGIGPRKPDGSCNMNRPLLVEIDTFSSRGTLSY